MTNELLKKREMPVLELDGKQYQIPMLNLNILDAIEEELGCGINGIQELFSKRQAGTLRGLVWAILKDNYPELTKEAIGQAIRFKDLAPVSDKIFAAIQMSLED